MARVFLGLVKGGLVGAVVGFGATKLGVSSGLLAWVTYGLVGLLVGLVCGKAIWRQETLWTPLLKGIFGVLVSLGLYWVAGKVLGGLVLPWNAQVGAAPNAALATVPVFLAPLIGIVYGIFVEIDDGGGKAAAGEAAKKKAG